MSSRTFAPTRRQLLALAAGSVAAPYVLTRARPAAAQATGGGEAPLNIVYVFTDQQRFTRSWPRGYSLPGLEWLQAKGTSFVNHYTSAIMCSPSRAVMLTGLQTPDNGIFDNFDMPYIKEMSAPTIGHMLRRAGYYTAYKGKWHLGRDFDTTEIGAPLTAEMEAFGFADFYSPGDLIGHTLGGYQFDNITTSGAINWLRSKGRPLTDEGRPWGLFVSLVNPHDVMYFNTDAPGEQVQDSGYLMLQAARAPDHELYRATWDIAVPDNLRQPYDAPGRPQAHGEFDRVWDYVLGHIPLEDERWLRFNNYYLNCIRNVDQQLKLIFDEVEALGLLDRTVIVFTADHGEMAGAHGLRGKGPFAYEETLHVPFHVVHPAVAGGRECRAVTSHVDLVPTWLSIAGADEAKRVEVAGRPLPGKDMTLLLNDPAAQEESALREAALFTYSALVGVDSGVFAFAAKAKAAGLDPMQEAKRTGYMPDLGKRGSLRTAIDGRYKFSRYFAPLDRSKPTTLEELYAWNDVELFDLASDPQEMTNLAADPAADPELVLTMRNKLAAAIEAEIGVDDGREMPQLGGIDWGIEKVDL